MHVPLILAILAMTLLLVSCTSLPELSPSSAEPVAPQRELENVPGLDGPAIVAAVYSFSDKTGQRRPSDTIAHISTAVTQGGEAFLIKALRDVGGGQWFRVVERVGLDNLIKERQLIRSTRDAFEGEAAKELRPMMFAGVIFEGGIIGYDTNTLTGGAGARYLGIGADTQYRQDVVTVTLRMVSVQTGEILLSTTVQKTVASTRTQAGMFKFFDVGTRAVEAEAGLSVNEPASYAVRTAIEKCVAEIIREGERKKIWKFKEKTNVE